MARTSRTDSNMPAKIKKRIALVDAGPNAEILRAVLPFIEDDYELEITDDRDAEYVLHSCFGNDVLKYSGIRIFESVLLVLAMDYL